MGTQERRERARAAVRRRIMSAARRLFAAEGYAAVSMRRIADAIEYSPTAIYLHFRDKDALVRELCAADFAALAVAFDALAGVADPVERLRLSADRYVRFAVDHPNHYRLMFMTEPPHARPDGEPAAAAADGTAYGSLLQTVREVMAAGRFRPGLTDVDLAAQTVWAAVHGVASLEIAKGTDPWIGWAPLAERTSTAVEAMMNGMLAAPEPGRHRRRGARP